MTKEKLLNICYWLYVIGLAISSLILGKFITSEPTNGSSMGFGVCATWMIWSAMVALLIEQIVFHMEFGKPRSKSKPSLDSETNRNRDNQTE